MREIKMKVYTSGGMIGPFDLSQHPMYWAHKLRDGERLLYTGLTDKNGVEIYEGDIVAVWFWDDEQKIYSETASVEFDEGSFILKIPNDEWSYFNGTQSVEVIGNIHEHSRLLEGEAE